jgi:hypothetical protein
MFEEVMNPKYSDEDIGKLIKTVAMEMTKEFEEKNLT